MVLEACYTPGCPEPQSTSGECKAAGVRQSTRGNAATERTAIAQRGADGACFASDAGRLSLLASNGGDTMGRSPRCLATMRFTAPRPASVAACFPVQGSREVHFADVFVFDRKSVEVRSAIPLRAADGSIRAMVGHEPGGMAGVIGVSVVFTRRRCGMIIMREGG